MPINQYGSTSNRTCPKIGKAVFSPGFANDGYRWDPYPMTGGISIELLNGIAFGYAVCGVANGFIRTLFPASAEKVV